MKKVLFILLSMSLVIGIYAVITDSQHDFSSATGNGNMTDAWNASGEKCKPCHIPHNSKPLSVGAPLWNHESTASTFTTYAGFDMDATPGQPSGISKLCLSCHDASIGLDQFSGDTTGTSTMTGSAAVGIDLSNDHPISFVYQDSIDGGDTELNTAAVVYSAGYTMGSAAATATVECSSCHDVHNTAGIASLLRESNANSAICLTCHAK